MAKKDRLYYFKGLYEAARSAYDVNAFERRKNQYDGVWDEAGKEPDVRWNITQELIESQVDSSIPRPKVTPQIATEKSMQNAKVIEAMLADVLRRIPAETINDEDERLVKVDGSTAYLVEWDNAVRAQDYIGDVSVRLLPISQVIPQQAVGDVGRMDYIFVTHNDTKARIKKRYHVDVEDESIDPDVTDKTTTEDDVVTQVVCYYINDDGLIGCFSWVGDTVLVDDDSYEARKGKVCAKCGRAKGDDDECVCGGKNWVTRAKDYEVLDEDIVTGRFIKTEGGGKVPVRIPAMSPVYRDGELVMEDYEIPMIQDGLPVMDYVFRDGLVVGEKHRMTTVQRPKLEKTKIPYYYPTKIPLVVRKNISVTDEIVGVSDCDVVRPFQQSINKLLTKATTKTMKAGSIVTRKRGSRTVFSDEDQTLMEVADPAELSMIQVKEFRVDISQDLSMIDRLYYMAKSVLGITDSYQGKPDSTATSGRAKEAQIAQAAGRQRSKRVMKMAAYEQMFEMIFKFMLAYSDEPRSYRTFNDDGEQIEAVFNRYDFLEMDEYGNWYYDDRYNFEVDEGGIDTSDKRMMLEDLRTDLSIGAYGNPQDPETMVAYWAEKGLLGYPNAKRNEERWREKVKQQKNALLNGPTVPPVPPAGNQI